MLGNIYIVKQAQTVAIASDFLNRPTVNVDKENDEDTALFCRSEIKHQKKITSSTVKNVLFAGFEAFGGAGTACFSFFAIQQPLDELYFFRVLHPVI